MVGIKLTGRDGPCVQNAVHDIVVWDTATGIVLDGGDNPDRPCYWNNFARVLVVRHTLHGVHLVRTGAGDTPNANKFHCVRVYSLGVPSTGSGFYVQHGRFNNAFVDCEANLSTTAHTCFRIGPDTDKNLLINLYTEFDRRRTERLSGGGLAGNFDHQPVLGQRRAGDLGPVGWPVHRL